jgi:hypothetical protein
MILYNASVREETTDSRPTFTDFIHNASLSSAAIVCADCFLEPFYPYTNQQQKNKNTKDNNEQTPQRESIQEAEADAEPD